MNKILTLDLGTCTGWAHKDEIITHGFIDFKSRRYEGGGMRYLRFKQFLQEMNLLNHIEVVVFEEVRRHVSTDSAHVYGGLLAILTSWCEQNAIPYKGIPVGTIKKFITGKGNSGKDIVIQAIRDRGYNVKDDNEADAIAILELVLKEGI